MVSCKTIKCRTTSPIYYTQSTTTSTTTTTAMKAQQLHTHCRLFLFFAFGNQFIVTNILFGFYFLLSHPQHTHCCDIVIRTDKFCDADRCVCVYEAERTPSVNRNRTRNHCKIGQTNGERIKNNNLARRKPISRLCPFISILLLCYLSCPKWSQTLAFCHPICLFSGDLLDSISNVKNCDFETYPLIWAMIDERF